ncbi:MAG TPA: DUF3090 domain-containing protein [Candidatus Binatia bacterium]|jgi:uncharacterized repeat protein (TIGR03847 family)|nr:DUF3090 domain-containing protein [Candidatus Binatia bacterium]
MARHIELNPASHITVNTVGPPGQRTFYLQGSKGVDTVSVTIEKQQAAVLANSFETLLAELARRNPPESREVKEQILTDMRLREPVESLFRVGRMEMGYSEAQDRVVLVAYELVDEEVEDPNAVSFWMTRAQVEALIPHIEEVVQAGRPICGNCGQPIDPEGHFCPKRNGHAR